MIQTLILILALTVAVVVAPGSCREMRNLIGQLSGFGQCYYCGDSWSWKKAHMTEYGEPDELMSAMTGKTMTGQACFPLCEESWLKLTPEQRLPFYRKLFDKWKSDAASGAGTLDGKPYEDHHNWSEIEKAVMEGR